MPRLVILFVQGRGSCAMRMGGLLVHLGCALMTLMVCSGILMGHGAVAQARLYPSRVLQGAGARKRGASTRARWPFDHIWSAGSSVRLARAYN